MLDIVLLKHRLGEVHLVGVVHSDVSYAHLVNYLIDEIKPHIVAVEFCRRNLESFRSRRRFSVNVEDDMPEQVRRVALGDKLLLWLLQKGLQYRDRTASPQSPIADNMSIFVRPKLLFGIPMGTEMVAPFRNRSWRVDSDNKLLACNDPSIKYHILLADQPLDDMLKAIGNALTEEDARMIKYLQKNFRRSLRLFSPQKRSPLVALLASNKRLIHALVHGRNEYMVDAYLEALRKYGRENKRLRIIAIVGAVHVTGMVKCWKKRTRNG